MYDLLLNHGGTIRLEKITASTSLEAIAIMNRAFAIWADAGFMPHSVELATSYLLPDGYSILGAGEQAIGTICIREAKPQLEGDTVVVSRAHRQDRARLHDRERFLALTAGKRFVYFYGFSIDPRHGRAGLGGALMMDLERMARQSGFHGLMLETGKESRWLFEWYGRLGFELIGESDADGVAPRTVMMLKTVTPTSPSTA